MPLKAEKTFLEHALIVMNCKEISYATYHSCPKPVEQLSRSRAQTRRLRLEVLIPYAACT